MPNWCNNEMTFKKEFANKIINLPEGKTDYTDGYVDFNLMVPMPEALNVETGSMNNEDLYIYLSNRFEKSIKSVKKMEESKLMDSWMFDEDRIEGLKKKFEGKDLEANYQMGKQLVDNYEKYGALTWYKWCCNNWGVKWNACGTCIYDENEEEYLVTFDTPWGPPNMWLESLCDAGVDFYLEWHEEQGYHGEYISENRTLTENDLEFEGYDWEDEEEYDEEEAEV